jgi:hypothetical protein
VINPFPVKSWSAGNGTTVGENAVTISTTGPSAGAPAPRALNAATTIAKTQTAGIGCPLNKIHRAIWTPTEREAWQGTARRSTRNRILIKLEPHQSVNSGATTV